MSDNPYLLDEGDQLEAVPGPAVAGGLTPMQRRTYDQLIDVSAPRPVQPPTLVEQLTDTIEQGTRDAVAAWTESSVYIGKAQLSGLQRCEGQFVAAQMDTGRYQLQPATAAGIAAHRAIQMAHTHPGHPPKTYVDQAIRASVRSEAAFAELWDNADLAIQSDLTAETLSKLVAFLDAWPPLPDLWAPRFEERMQVKIGRLTLAARVDLTLGRPRPDGTQTMMLCDLKTGSIGDHHVPEAEFYALVATLRHGVAPFRSTVYSLASATWTDPDVTVERLHASAAAVVDVTNRYVQLLTDQRTPELAAGRHCSWCPLKADCPAAAALEQDGGPPAQDAA